MFITNRQITSQIDTDFFNVPSGKMTSYNDRALLCLSYPELPRTTWRQIMKREFIHGTWQKNRSFSPAVITQGNDQRIIWLAGYGAPQTPDGASLAGDFEAQTRQSFANIEIFLNKSGARLADIVQMTVFIIDSRYGNQFTDLRKEFFPDGNFPGSAMITAAGFAQPEMMVEIQGIAVVED
jgi:2-iminobutanoate/2-iminopropanoate deaminase